MRPPHHLDIGETAGRQHADLARPDKRAPPQHGLAARDVGAGVGDKLAGRDGAPDVDRRALRSLDELGMLDHHHGVGAARHDAAGRNGGRGPGFNRESRCLSTLQTLGLEPQAPRHRVGRADRIRGRDRKPIDAGAVERRRVGWRDDIGRQHAAERRVEPQSFRRHGGEIEMARETRQRVLGVTTSRNCSWRAARRTASSRSSLLRYFDVSFMAAAAVRSWPRRENPRSPAARESTRRRG